MMRKEVMQHDNASTIQGPALPPQTLYRGLYIRIAKRLKIDPSYVSRVARGERHSKSVELALRHEIDQINKKLNASSLGFVAKPERAAGGKRLRFFVSRNRRGIRAEWLRHSIADPNLKRIKLPPQKRTSPVLPLIDEALKATKLSLREMATLPLKSATQHGRVRLAQGYKSRHLLEEYNLIRRCVFALAEENLSRLDSHFLIHDLGQFGEALDLQSQKALEALIGEA
jgi:transcriptional regulator with XRE-family HTH domain